VGQNNGAKRFDRVRDTANIGIAAFILQAYIILYISVSCLQGLKKPLYAIWVGLYRQIAAPLLIFFGMVHMLELGILSVFWGIFGITWSAALFTLWYSRRVLQNTGYGGVGIKMAFQPCYSF
jgi:Na+-driven multidrug efflux pump